MLFHNQRIIHQNVVFTLGLLVTQQDVVGDRLCFWLLSGLELDELRLSLILQRGISGCELDSPVGSGLVVLQHQVACHVTDYFLRAL